ncbi:hypothetical protein [Shivajiella indica]|uniref:Uncharacterized protein n=1 Tax=Shivajiella indica TaxID=872115 RepID=A0ABW5BBV3_9BACT
MISFVSLFFVLLGFATSNIAQTLPLSNNFVDQEKIKNFEDHLLLASSAKAENILELEKLNIIEAKSAYDRLSFEEKEQALEFPFLETWVIDQLIKLQGINGVNVSFVYSIPPEKQVMEKSVWEKLMKTKKVNAVLDGRQVSVNELKAYSPKDFASFELVQTKKGGLFRQAAYDFNLTTNEKYDKDFKLTSKELNTIIAEYANGEEIIVPFFMIERTFISDLGGKLAPNYPVNYLGIILEEIINKDFDGLIEKSQRLDNAPGIWIYITNVNGDHQKLFVKYQ